MRTALMKVMLIIMAMATPLSACVATPNGAISTDAFPKTAAIETRAPGDFQLEGIIKGAERHMEIAGYTDIPADELKQLYPNIAGLPVEIRGRRAADGTEYLVMATADRRDISLIPDAEKVLKKDAARRAEELQMEYSVAAGGVNKYGAVALANSDPNEII